MFRLLFNAICQRFQYRTHCSCSVHAFFVCSSYNADALLQSDAVTTFPPPHPSPLLSPAAIWTLRQRSPRLCYAYLATLRSAELVRSAYLFAAYARAHHLCHTTPQALLATWQRRIAAYRTKDSIL